MTMISEFPMPRTTRLLSIALMTLMTSTAFAHAKPLDGVTLTLASQNDPFAGVLTKLAAQFKEDTGAELKVEVMDYGTLLTKTTADFVGDTKGYDLVTMDIVWAGAYAENGYSVDLTDWVKRDAAELDLDDIYPVILESLGQYNGHYVAFPFAAYANVLAYRKDLFEAAGLAVPKTVEELVSDAKKLTDPSKKQYGFVANGQKGPAVAQDWMQYNNQMGGSILGKDGLPALNSPENVESLAVYKQLFVETAPPGAIEYDWGGREESFRQGAAAMMQTWSVGAPGYSDPASSNVVGKVGIAVAPVANGVSPQYGVGGWGMAINADIDAKQKEAAWTFIKWLTSKKIHKEFNLEGAGSFMRKSQMTDPDLTAKFDFLPVVAKTYENGNGDYRPRIPEYPEIQDILGAAVNSVLAGAAEPKAALDEAQAEAKKLF
ncbi:sugar ABC transporter substrate-binding protein (plasmid) [Rhizobium leguminosarum]|jgi:multiple sugar transport system substrate-binding protein|uniref:Sugar ABC transporter substrate-binding protein n=1 Tax=Rhizobium beringeri TaxID=3019934 RepID=A0ABY1XNE6_9HYPH|nr:sugar ABC transporter substrate-binding protein [Rhizobium leguminosarum]NKL61550.1 extracellular solute-binding protein [Rhizobium leguminosarum bv. viciae]TBE62516.1 sugar ABC transporter substrate-binding protein [Rhizobium beringeri]RWX13944.1 sugar ABC transporter substrate-binding protein [Rhizobium leguminosarum]TAU45780.1 sugar ABC transporter substrate-binding protein [Rhizobium leguminosarum]